MIRYDGYYIEEPTEVYNGRSKGEKSSYSFTGYSFLDSKNLRISSKHELLSHLTDFAKKDFKGGLAIEKNVQIEKDKIIISKSYSFENELTFKIINSNKIYNETFKKYMYFVPWSDTKSVDNFEDSIFYRLFGPFYHKKYHIYYE